MYAVAALSVRCSRIFWITSTASTRRAAFNMRRHYGIDNSYLFIEARDSEAELDGSELGGKSYLGGLLFEF